MKKPWFLILRLVIAIILIQTLYFKFSGHEDSIYIFTKAGLEPYGRIGIGIAELIAAILLFLPKTVWLGALLSLAIISGALLMHLTKLGIVINNDGGFVFGLAIVVFVISLILLLIERKNIPFIGKNL